MAGDDTNTTYLYTDYYTAAFPTSVNVGGSLASHLPISSSWKPACPLGS